MALTAVPRRLLQTLLNNTLVSRFKNTTGQKQVIKEIILCNVDSLRGSVWLAIVPNGETVGLQHRILSDVDILSEETKIFSDLSLVLELNDDIYIQADRDISVYISAAEFVTIT